MKCIKKMSLPEGLRENSPKYVVFGLFAALFLLANCTPVPVGKSITSKAAFLDFDTLPSINISTRNKSENDRTRSFQTDIVPLRDGETALHSRLAMIDSARHTLDVSAFIIRQDNAGYLFADRLVSAANRGVKVRLLLDDLFNQRTAGRFLALDYHPNIEIRIFNPFSRFTPAPVSFLLDYDRVSRRMHSRMMVADSQEAILGGRNIADEYFSDNDSSAFNDFELLVRGHVARRFSESFEMYWSDIWTVQLHKIGMRDYAISFSKLLKKIPVQANKARDNKYSTILTPKLELLDQRSPPRFDAQTEFVTDVPQKLRQDNSEGPFLVAESHFSALAQAEREVLIVTPYFIPEKHGVRVLQALAARGVEVTIVTNSLASTNHVAVHGGYSSYRDRLIRAGVNIHELSSGSEPGRTGSGIQNTLHAKFTIIDRTQTIITTMNFDPVSIRGNLETSLVVRSSAFAKWMLQRVNPISLNRTYRLSLKEGGSLAWFRQSGSGSAHPVTEPGANMFRRVISDFSQLLISESML